MYMHARMLSCLTKEKLLVEEMPGQFTDMGSHADGKDMASVLYVNDVQSTASALDLVHFLEACSPGNKVLACRLQTQKARPVRSHAHRLIGAGARTSHQ